MFILESIFLATLQFEAKSMKHLGDLTWFLQPKVDYERGKSMTITQKFA